MKLLVLISMVLLVFFVIRGKSRGKKSWSLVSVSIVVVYYEEIKRTLKRRPIHECRYDERIKTKTEGSTRLAHTGLIGELEPLKTETRLINERFVSVMGECVIHADS